MGGWALVLLTFTEEETEEEREEEALEVVVEVSTKVVKSSIIEVVYSVYGPERFF